VDNTLTLYPNSGDLHVSKKQRFVTCLFQTSRRHRLVHWRSFWETGKQCNSWSFI